MGAFLFRDFVLVIPAQGILITRIHDRSDSMTLTKASIISHVADDDMGRSKAAHVVESLLEILKYSLQKGESVLVSGFGKFSVKGKNERRGRNPATGADLMLRGRRIVVFKTSTVLRDKINQG